ncbi:hypothetical protein [Roseiconus lacunae]|uniref:hypothetical protein n=1 Tax=Roseiconus lacunae TaxID=2605694 RepID=UPI001E3CC551|nr:hypothetical protein [Roseiconus lacunae]MCD0459123.1 hypothetical protein [Roseiconus lacunae]
MSKLFGLGRKASEYVRRRSSRATQAADNQIDRQSSSDYVRSRKRTWEKLTDFVFGGGRRRRDTTPPEPPPVTPGYVQPPPVTPGFVPPAKPPGSSPQDTQGQTGSTGGEGQSPPRPPRGPTTGFPPGGDDDDSDDDELGYGDIQLLGRDASYDPKDWKVVMDQMRLTPGSSNVYGYYFEFESRTMGILYVTFLATHRDGTRGGAGPTYAYYNIPGRKYHEFRRASATSAGSAVWDYLRVRGTEWAHQHQYRLIQPQGDYVPRKATKRGLRTRHVPVPGVGRREFRRSSLPEAIRPDRGEPDRGLPDRG